jgi:hypothetical protein
MEMLACLRRTHGHGQGGIIILSVSRLLLLLGFITSSSRPHSVLTKHARRKEPSVRPYDSRLSMAFVEMQMTR